MLILDFCLIDDHLKQNYFHTSNFYAKILRFQRWKQNNYTISSIHLYNDNLNHLLAIN